MEYKITKANESDIDDIMELYLKLMLLHRNLDTTFFSEFENNLKNYRNDLIYSIKKEQYYSFYG